MTFENFEMDNSKMLLVIRVYADEGCGSFWA